MAVAIIDTLTTISEVCLLQGHGMNDLKAADGTTRVFSDDLISTVINNVIRFVYANSDEDCETTAELFAVNTISTLALNNIMAEAGYLPNWEIVDPYNKDILNRMIESKKESSNQIDVIPFYRDQKQLYQ